MPELPEVEGVVRALAPVAIGRTIQKVTVSDTVIKSKQLGKEAMIKGITTEDFIDRYGWYDDCKCHTAQ